MIGGIFMERKSKDFGMKIDGARKDKRQKENKIPLPQIKEMANFLLITRDNIWPETNGEELIAAGIPQGVAYWREQIRKAIPPNPKKADERSMINYFNTVWEIRESVEQITEPSEVSSFFTFLQHRYFSSSANDNYTKVIEQGKDVINATLLREAQTEYCTYENRAKKMFYGISKENKAALLKQNPEKIANTDSCHSSLYSNRKKPFPISQLSSFSRNGPAYLPEGGHTGEREFSALGIRGVEFGAWMSDADAQFALDQSYHALLDLAHILKIQPEDISLGGTLALSFGARGHGNSAAFYEARHQVICLPKGNGNGFLAHAWAHALDDFIGKFCGVMPVRSASFASWHERSDLLPESVRELLSVMTYKTINISPEEQIASFIEEEEQNRQNEEIYFQEAIQAVTPESLTSKQQSRWDKAVQSIYDNRCFADIGTYRISDYGNPTIEALSQLHKEFTGHVIPRRKRWKINYPLYFINQAERHYLPPVKTIEKYLPRQYLTGSMKMNQQFIKTMDRPYYSIELSELFARAFDCYVADKLREAGIQNQFLTAHANDFVFKNDDGETIYAIPVGEERKLINQKFDVMIQEMKELGILHQREISECLIPHNHNKPTKSEQKTSLADIRNIVAKEQKKDTFNRRDDGYSYER